MFSKFRRASYNYSHAPQPSRTFLTRINLTTDYGRSTALPITGLRDGSLNNPECPFTCARRSSTIALNSSISSFSSAFSLSSFPFSSRSLENSVPEDVLGVFVGVLLGISLSFASMVWICRRDILVHRNLLSEIRASDTNLEVLSHRACSSIKLWVFSYASSRNSIFLYLLSSTFIASVCSLYFCTSASL